MKTNTADGRLSRRKKRLPLLFTLVFLFFIAGCTFFSTRQETPVDSPSGFRANVSADQMSLPLPVEIADDIRKIANGQETSQAREAWQNVTPPQAAAATQVKAENQQPMAQAEETRKPAQFAAETAPQAVSRSGRSEKYKVKRGDTLMKIAFEKYGNLYRWREIYNANREKIANFNAVPPGTILTINGVEYVKIERNGKPYLIRWSDTLVKISRHLYGTSAFWKDIWQNNPQLIHDPNKIYAGFTLYYNDKDKLPSPTLSQSRARAKSEPGRSNPRVPSSKQ